MLDRIEQIVRSAIDRGGIPGAVVLVERDGKVVYSLFKGYRQIQPSREEMTMDTLFDLASLTKPLATAILILRFISDDGIGLERRIGELVPAVVPSSRDLTIAQLLLHTAGLPPDPFVYKLFPDPGDIDLERAERAILSIEPTVTPGTQVIYSCTGYLILGLILRRLTGARVGSLFKSNIAGPAGLTDLCFHADSSLKSRIAPTEYCNWRKRWIRGQVHDENSFVFKGEGGNAGLFGTARDVPTLLSLFCSEGQIGRVRILSNDSVSLMKRCLTRGLNERRSVGFKMQDRDSPVGGLFGRSSFGHTGFTGTSLWLDPEKKLKIVVLTNRVHLGREATEMAISTFRKKVHAAIYRAFA